MKIPGVILASQSPRRRDLLKKIIAKFEILPSLVNETIRAELGAEKNARLLARSKTLEVSRKRLDAYVVGADTLVVLEGEIIGKPVDTEDAKRILHKLSGKTHEVITGVAVAAPGGYCVDSCSISTVTFRPLTEEDIESYIVTGEPMDKAGAYAIQGEGGRFVTLQRGSWSNIVGLPMRTVRELLVRQGYPI